MLEFLWMNLISQNWRGELNMESRLEEQRGNAAGIFMVEGLSFRPEWELEGIHGLDQHHERWALGVVGRRSRTMLVGSGASVEFGWV